MTATPRGIRNNNPGNIRKGPRWNGSVPERDYPATHKDEQDYTVFSHMVFGIRALTRLLMTYKRKHGVRTLTALVKRYAPKSDGNPTKEYIDYLADQLGVTPRKRIDLEDYNTLAKLVPAIIRFEVGPTHLVNENLVLAGMALADIPNAPVIETYR